MYVYMNLKSGWWFVRTGKEKTVGHECLLNIFYQLGFLTFQKVHLEFKPFICSHNNKFYQS